MKPFENVTREGNEKAIRKGQVVPEGDVNLAYVRSPELSPKDNVVIVDTSRIVEENIAIGTNARKLYYANPIGILVDEDNNVAVSDEYPVVSDVFSIDEDFNIDPGNEYTRESILPYVHVSRFFHLDHAGLVMGDDKVSYKHEAIKVVDSKGNEYSNYRIKITPVYIKNLNEDDLTNTGSMFPASTWGYRVFAYIDRDDHEDLYLTYNKIEVQDDGKLVRRRIGYSELLNPNPFFSYVPEESEVVDPANREKHIYSSKPIAYTNDILGENSSNADGYRIYVPKKAIGDPRLYQLFRWRVRCNFIQEFTIDPSRDFQTVRCGVLVTSSDLATNTPSRSPFALLNLARSRYNAANIFFQNPAKPNHDRISQENRNYWFVNIDTDDLSQYDLLIWSPNTMDFNFSPYAGKIDHFVRTLGGTVFIDSNNYSDPYLSLGGRTTAAFNPTTGSLRRAVGVNNSITPVRSDFPRWGTLDHILLNANARLGGWNFNTAVEERVFVQGMQIQDYNGAHLITRAGVCEVLRIVGTGIEGFTMPQPRRFAFPDVTLNTQYRVAIETMAAFFDPQVAMGDSSGNFRPTEIALRVHVASFFDRFYTQLVKQFPQLSPITGGSVGAYSDVHENHSQAGAIGRMHASGIMIGFNDGTFRPNAQVSQQQIGWVVERFINYVKSQVTDFISDVDMSENIYFMSYVQSGGRKYSQSFDIIPPGYSSILETRNSPTDLNYKTVTVARQEGEGHKIFSTFGHLYTCSSLMDHRTNAIVSNNFGPQIIQHSDYTRNINGIGVEGAMKLLYNSALLAMKGRALDSSDHEQFSTSWSYYTPWRSSWVIDARDDILSEREKAEHNFVIDAKDIFADDRTPIWKRQLSSKSVKELIDDAVAHIMDNPTTRNRIEGSAREYEIEITNPYVESSSLVVENSPPMVWTEAYTPRFTVPAELGPHIVKEEVDETGERGRRAQYDDATYMHKEYPEKPYAGRITSTYIASEAIGQSNFTNYVVNGTAVGTIRKADHTPPSSTSVTRDIAMSWWDSQVSTRNAATRGDPLTAGEAWTVNLSNPHYGMRKANGITPWQDRNYYTNDWGPGHLAFPYWGHQSRLTRGVSADTVRFLQDALNRIMDARYFNATRLNVDGLYGPATENVVRSFQTQMNARWKDGVCDAETWSLVGIQVHRLAANGRLGPVNPNNYTKWYAWHDRVQPHRVSNSANDWVAKRSWRSGGPTMIWELYAIRFRETHNWHGVTVVPYVIGDYDRMMVRSVHVGNNTDMRNFNSQWSQLKEMSHRPRDGQALYIPMGPYSGNTITIGVGQDMSSGWGSARMLGVRDIKGHTRVTSSTTIPGSSTIYFEQEAFNFTVTGSTSVESLKDRVIQIQAPSWQATYHTVADIRFHSIVVSNPEVSATITQSGQATFRTQIVSSNTGTEIVQGQAFPASGFTYYAMDEEGRLNPVPETGWISKSDGIKLLCDNKKKPIGFPPVPTNVGTSEAQRHYVKMSLGTTGTDSSVQLGFFDFARQEFITSHEGKPEISFIEYLVRGPHNVYIAVISDYETAQEKIVPIDEDAPRLPYKWAMPVYGVATKAGSKITLEALPDRLAPHDLWPIAIREGSFVRDVEVRSRWEGGLTSYLASYQNTKVKAFYNLPEAGLGGYSPKYGPPNFDVINEEPIIQDDDVIQVRQAPILMIQHPTRFPNKSDPVRPVFTLYKRETRNSPWVEQPLSEIRDYNASTGELFLRHRLTSNDASLLRVDYTSTIRHYQFKRDGDLMLNLNAYSGHTRDLIGEAIYVYIVPHFVKDEYGNVIPDSLQERTLRVALEPNVFDPLQPEYDPLAIQLGVVYISTALDVSRLAILDTRRRGGGISDSVNVREITRLINDAATYWDIGHAVGGSYQKSGYIVIRLPDELREVFSEEEIIEVVKRNVGAGVGFKLENLQGEDWS